jgi:hypothetical protein
VLFDFEIMVTQSNAIVIPPSDSTRYIGSLRRRKDYLDYFSTGRLERLLELGITPHILVPRPYAEIDTWWRALLPRSHAVQATDNQSRERALKRCVHELLERYDLKWPYKELRHDATEEVPTPLPRSLEASRPRYLLPTLRKLSRYGFLSAQEIDLLTI